MSEATTREDDLASFRTLLASRGVPIESVRAAADGTVGASAPTLLSAAAGQGAASAVTAAEQAIPSPMPVEDDESRMSVAVPER